MPGKPGRGGPPPKRESQRRRRNKPATATKKAAAAAEVTVRDGEPPRTGPGSSTSVWIEYARGLGHDVPSDAKRGWVIALVDEHPEGPDTSDSTWHVLAREWYQSLAGSAQSQFYEPSDWATAKVGAEVLSKALSAPKVVGKLIEEWQKINAALLGTEGERLRARVELDRAKTGSDEEPVADVADLDAARRRRGAS